MWSSLISSYMDWFFFLFTNIWKICFYFSTSILSFIIQSPSQSTYFGYFWNDDYSLNFENSFSLLLVVSQAILNNASWKLPFTSSAIKQDFFLTFLLPAAKMYWKKVDSLQFFPHPLVFTHTCVHMHWFACKCPPPVISAVSDCACLAAESLHVPFISQIQLIWNQTPLQNVKWSVFLEGMTVASFHLPLSWGPVAPTCATQFLGSLSVSQGLPPPALGKSLDKSSHFPPAYCHGSFSPELGLLCFAEGPRCCSNGVHPCRLFSPLWLSLVPQVPHNSLSLVCRLQPCPECSRANSNCHFFSVQFCF